MTMVIVSVKSRPRGIVLLEPDRLLKDVSREPQGVLNICVASPVDGVSLSVNENADPDVRTDHIAAIRRLHPPPGDLQSMLFRKSVTLPYSGRRFSLGTWQGIYLIDLRERADKPVNLVLTARPSARREQFSVNAAPRDATQLEPEIAKRIPAADGALLVHQMHTSASLNIGCGSLEPVMNRVVPEAWHHEFFEHTLEGVDDMTGHLKCSLLGCSTTVPVIEKAPMLPVRLNEHRYAGGYGVGHNRKVLVDYIRAAEPSAYEICVDSTTELGVELAKRGGTLSNVVVGEGRGGLLVGSRSAVEGFKAPDEAILAQSVDWPAEAQAVGAQLWWRGGPATLRVSSL